MFLKSLEIIGFKSFPDKTIINFQKGITAIVGPNGSGKSNISDALRWVLGEQSTKNLRGNKMEDVIFDGTKNRKPQGFAEVSLTIDNTDRALDMDYNEITVTRRYYRSGDSDYFINKTPVRLKDINELFMDTGLGKDGYSIIGQGKIAEILSSKGEDRRQVLEEAAGISKSADGAEFSGHRFADHAPGRHAAAHICPGSRHHDRPGPGVRPGADLWQRDHGGVRQADRPPAGAGGDYVHLWVCQAVCRRIQSADSPVRR